MRPRFLFRIAAVSLLFLATPLMPQEPMPRQAHTQPAVLSELHQNPLLDISQDFLPRADVASPIPAPENLAEPAYLTDGFHDLFSLFVEKVTSTAEELRLYLSTLAASTPAPHS